MVARHQCWQWLKARCLTWNVWCRVSGAFFRTFSGFWFGNHAVENHRKGDTMNLVNHHRYGREHREAAEKRKLQCPDNRDIQTGTPALTLHKLPRKQKTKSYLKCQRHRFSNEQDVGLKGWEPGDWTGRARHGDREGVPWGGALSTTK